LEIELPCDREEGPSVVVAAAAAAEEEEKPSGNII